MATTRNTGPMCVVTIDFHEYLLSAADGMKLVGLMSKAVKCDVNGYRPRIATIGDQPEVSLEMINRNHVRQRAPESRQLDYDPSPSLEDN